MAAPAPTRRGFLAGLLAAPLAVPAAGSVAAMASPPTSFRWISVGVPMLDLNRIPPFDPSLGEGVWRGIDPVYFRVSLPDLPATGHGSVEFREQLGEGVRTPSHVAQGFGKSRIEPDVKESPVAVDHCGAAQDDAASIYAIDAGSMSHVVQGRIVGKADIGIEARGTAAEGPVRQGGEGAPDLQPGDRMEGQRERPQIMGAADHDRAVPWLGIDRMMREAWREMEIRAARGQRAQGRKLDPQDVKFFRRHDLSFPAARPRRAT